MAVIVPNKDLEHPEPPSNLAIFDPHMHLFDLQLGEYAWLNTLSQDKREIIARSFSLSDLNLHSSMNLIGAAHIEAGFDNARPWRELAHIESKVAAYKTRNKHFHLSNVSNINLLDSTQAFEDSLHKIASYASCVGVRHILDDDADALLSHRQVVHNLSCVAEHGLSFDLQVPLDNLITIQRLREVLISIPSLRIALNHAGFPAHSADQLTLSNWKRGIEVLAEHPLTVFKCSGWEMQNAQYKVNDLSPALAFLRASVGDERIMFASNFPLNLLRCSYADYWQHMHALAKTLNFNIDKVFRSNAMNFYTRN